MPRRMPCARTATWAFASWTCTRSLTADASAPTVDGVTFGMRRGECFGLLGHNGAGKTTTVSMLSGLIMPTAGDAYINGHSIRTDMDVIHSSLGVCPQHDLLWPDVTAAEHLAFYGRLKGLSGEELDKEIARLLEAVSLTEFGNKGSKTFSGGMQRRLSIACSLIGNPAVVFLDEPTTGLDPENRRGVWHVIGEALNNDSIVVLTTHSMEEAEALSDRLGIMASGKLRAVGTSAHLKGKFGAGYRISLTMDVDSRDQSADDSDGAVAFVQDLLPAARYLTDISRGSNHHFEVARDDVDLGVVFREMEENKQRIGVADWGLSQTTLEDVFLAINKLYSTNEEE